MTVTPRLSLPLLAAGQAQKHVTHNDALTRLDGLIHLAVASRSETAPPGSPTETSAYIVPTGGSGVFAGRPDQLALFEDGGWSFLSPRIGWQCWVEDEAELHVWTGTEWRRASPLSSLGAELWGVNATADTTTRFVVAAPASLFNHDGAGHQAKPTKPVRQTPRACCSRMTTRAAPKSGSRATTTCMSRSVLMVQAGPRRW